MNKLKNKVVIITGASKGIGASIAKLFAAEGAKVIVNYSSSKDAAEQVVKSINDIGGKAVALQADMSKEEDVIRLFKETVSTFKGLDILINNAGIYNYEPVEAITVGSIQQQLNINILGPLLTIREAVKLFGDRGGNIINISSVAAELPLPTGSVYSATKAALDALTISLSKEFAGRGIRINSILPGVVETEGSRKAGFIGSEAEKEMITKTPLGRTGQPEDIAKVAVFLASNESEWINGERISVSGGIYGL